MLVLRIVHQTNTQNSKAKPLKPNIHNLVQLNTQSKRMHHFKSHVLTSGSITGVNLYLPFCPASGHDKKRSSPQRGAGPIAGEYERLSFSHFVSEFFSTVLHHSRSCVHLAIMFPLLPNICPKMNHKSGTGNWQIDGAWLSEWNWNWSPLLLLHTCAYMVLISLCHHQDWLQVFAHREDVGKHLNVFDSLHHVFIPF